MTPAEVAIKLDGRAKELKRERELLLVVAHTNASLQRTKKIPPLKKFLENMTKKADKKGDAKKQKEWFHNEIGKEI
jgi:hypothetical protein